MKSDKSTPNVPTLRFNEFNTNWQSTTLKNVCEYRKIRRTTEKKNYVSTENIMQNFQGIERFISTEHISGDGFNKNDILMANIRPYLKKVCFADFDGVCNADVLVFNSKTINPKFLYCVLANDNFINYVMSSVKGSKMPRGDKNFIMQYPLSLPSETEQLKISDFIECLTERIKVQNKIISKYESLIKGIRHIVFSSIDNREQYPLGNFLNEYSEKNVANNLQSVAVGKYGIRKREDIYSKELSTDYSKNKVIRKDTLIIGMGSTQIDIGILVEDEKYCVSPAYTTYHISGINSFYLQEYLVELNQLLSVRYMITSARQGKAVNKNDLLRHILTVHCLDEQERICKHFKSLYKRLQIEKEMLSALRKQKAFLLKSMFI